MLGIAEAHVAILSACEMAHVGYVHLERALYFLVLCEYGFDVIVFVAHGNAETGRVEVMDYLEEMAQTPETRRRATNALAAGIWHVSS